MTVTSSEPCCRRGVCFTCTYLKLTSFSAAGANSQTTVISVSVRCRVQARLNVSVQRCSFIKMCKYFRELCTGFLCLLKSDAPNFCFQNWSNVFSSLSRVKTRLLFWTLVKQNKSAIASKTNHLFYWPVLFFFSCPWEKWCWQSLWGSDHGAQTLPSITFTSSALERSNQ